MFPVWHLYSMACSFLLVIRYYSRLLNQHFYAFHSQIDWYIKVISDMLSFIELMSHDQFLWHHEQQRQLLRLGLLVEIEVPWHHFLMGTMQEHVPGFMTKGVPHLEWISYFDCDDVHPLLIEVEVCVMVIKDM